MLGIATKLKGTLQMGYYKSLIIDTIDEDQTDPRDMGNYDIVLAEEPSAVDWAMSELNNAIGTLEKHGATGYVAEVKEYRARLQKVIDNTLKPF